MHVGFCLQISVARSPNSRAIFSLYLVMEMDGSREIPQQLMDVANLKLRAKMKYEKILSLFSASRDGNVWLSRNSPVNKGRS